MTTFRSWKPVTAAAVPLLATLVAACGGSGGSGSHSAGVTQSRSNHAASPAPGRVMIAAASGAGGVHLVSGSGRAIYLWVADKGSRSECTGSCAQNWPPVVTKGAPIAGSGAIAADLGTTMRSDGSEQVTYKGHPLYFFLGDQKAGETYGQGSTAFGAKWWLVAPSGSAITSVTGGGARSPAGSSTGSPTSGAAGSSSKGYSGGSSGGSSSGAGGWG